jgi:hypothetical protein
MPISNALTEPEINLPLLTKTLRIATINVAFCSYKISFLNSATPESINKGLSGLAAPVYPV